MIYVMMIRHGLRHAARTLSPTSAVTCRRTYSTPLSDPENRGRPQRKVNFDLLGAWDNRLNLPILLERSIKEGKPIPQIRLADVGASTVIGRRAVNEDRAKVKWMTTRDGAELLYVAVFDGHAGESAADFVWAFMDEYLQILLFNDDDAESALRQAFVNISNLFNRHLHHHSVKLMRDGDSKGIRDMMGGTTATVCLVRDSSELVVAHVGDSRAILCRQGKALRLMKDHNPETEAEVKRVHARGGNISCNSLGAATVNGRLAMTRSIGDVDLKAYGVTAVPDINTQTIKHSRDGFLVLITDGVSAVMSDQELVDFIGSCSSPQEAATFVTDQALHYGSEDSSSAVVVPFGAWGKYGSPSGPGSFMAGFGRNIIGKSYV